MVGIWAGGADGVEQLLQCGHGGAARGEGAVSGNAEVEAAMVRCCCWFDDFADCGVYFGAAGELQDGGDISGSNASCGQDLDFAGGLLVECLQYGGSGECGLAATAGEYGLEAEFDDL